MSKRNELSKNDREVVKILDKIIKSNDAYSNTHSIELAEKLDNNIEKLYVVNAELAESYCIKKLLGTRALSKTLTRIKKLVAQGNNPCSKEFQNETLIAWAERRY